MSVHFNVKELSKEEKEKIVERLTIKPIENFYTKKREFYKEDNDGTVMFFGIENGTIKIPKYAARELLGKYTETVRVKTDLKFTGKLRDYQIPVLKEATKLIDETKGLTLGLYPGFGKTVLGAVMACEKKMLTVVLVHREILLTQWEDTFKKNTNALIWVVGSKVPKECNVIICMDTRYHMIPDELVNETGFLIIDEAHCFCTSSRVNCLLCFKPEYVLIETATLERDDGMHVMMETIAGSARINIEPSKIFDVYKVNTGIIPIRKKNRSGDTDWMALNKSLLLNDERNEMLTKAIVNVRNQKEKILVLTSLIEHAEILKLLIEKNGKECDTFCGTKKSYKDCGILIGTIPKIGTGFDPASFCKSFDGIHYSVLFIVSSIKKMAVLVQCVGRVLRSDRPTIFHLVDDDSIIESHWKKCSVWYKRRNATISECGKKSAVKESDGTKWAKKKIVTEKIKNNISNEALPQGSTWAMSKILKLNK